MGKIKNRIEEHPAYTDYTGTNEQFLSELACTIRDIIKDLNERNSITDDIFSRLSETINVSNAVFRTFSNHEGLELILRLKSISELYKKNLNNNSNLIRIAEHLLKKLEKFNNTFYHELSSNEIIYPELPHYIPQDEYGFKKELYFKWITFERNGSFFISRFNQLDIADYPYQESSGTNYEIFYNGKTIALTDLMKTPDIEIKLPSKVLIIDKGKYSYAADLQGREIHGTYDMISPLIEQLDVQNRNFSGRVRIFGRRYLVLRHD